MVGVAAAAVVALGVAGGPDARESLQPTRVIATQTTQQNQLATVADAPDLGRNKYVNVLHLARQEKRKRADLDDDYRQAASLPGAVTFVPPDSLGS